MSVAETAEAIATALVLAKQDLRLAILAKGVDVPDGTTIRDLAPYILLIETAADPVDPGGSVQFPYTLPFALG